MRKYIFFILLLFTFYNLSGQEEQNKFLKQSLKRGWEYQIRAGANIGGTTPFPMPKEIRKILSYNPKLNGSIEGVVTKRLACNPNVGIWLGLRLEEKGMDTGAMVKNYSTEIIYEGSRVAGYWTGEVSTHYKSAFITLPIGVNYRLSSRWDIRGGIYLSYRMDGEFSGFVSHGSLREGSPIGERVSFSGEQCASYDFSSHLQYWLWGEQVGASWRAFKHLSVYADLSYGLNNLFEKDFKTITFSMYPLYMNMGFAYRF
jgi:hypothetical protein